MAATSMSPSTASNSRLRLWWISWAWRVGAHRSRSFFAAVLGTSSTPFVPQSPIFPSSLSPHCDLAEAERSSILEKFRQSTAEWNQNINVHHGDCTEPGNIDLKSSMIVVTDACLPFVASGEAPILARILINYELPTKKETYLRRMSTCLAADGIVINMVVGGEVVALKGIEESSGLVIAEMPINISEIL